jgi:uncharacterized protein YjgD (DUF1641 family)
MDYNYSGISHILTIPSSFRKSQDIDDLMSLTKNVNFFEKITKEQESDAIHRKCCGCMTLEEYEFNEILFNIGDKGDKFYIILTGSVSVKVPMKKKLTVNKENIHKLEKLLQSTQTNDLLSQTTNSSRKTEAVISIKVSDIIENLNPGKFIAPTEENEKQYILDTEEKNLMKLFKKDWKRSRKLFCRL